MGNVMNIYIENLPPFVNEEQIRELFSSYGQVESVVLIQDKHTGISHGKAHVVMPSEIDAEQAIAGLDGTEYKGQTLKVKVSFDGDFPTGNFW